jgi:hypothetical protein
MIMLIVIRHARLLYLDTTDVNFPRLVAVVISPISGGCAASPVALNAKNPNTPIASTISPRVSETHIVINGELAVINDEKFRPSHAVLNVLAAPFLLIRYLPNIIKRLHQKLKDNMTAMK